jgi:RHS repeat-associated protein
VNTYYYHTDHLGSVHLVSDYQGRVYEHIEYTPYGELWVEHGPEGLEAVPYRFTGKELDEETGLYYYGARYLNPRTSRWVSADPALDTYLPEVPINNEARRRNKNLPGQGGVFNTVNLAVYHYAGNNPLKYIDPNGQQTNRIGFSFAQIGFMQTIMDTAKTLPVLLVANTINCMKNWFSNVFSGKAKTEAIAEIEVTGVTVDLTNMAVKRGEPTLEIDIPIVSTGEAGISAFAGMGIEEYLEVSAELGIKAEFTEFLEAKGGLRITAPTTGEYPTLVSGNLGGQMSDMDQERLNRVLSILIGKIPE